MNIHDLMDNLDQIDDLTYRIFDPTCNCPHCADDAFEEFAKLAERPFPPIKMLG